MSHWINIKDKKPIDGENVLIVYKNCFNKNVITIGHFTPKFSDDNYDSDGDFYDYDEENDKYYVPEGWYERAYNHEDYCGYFLENQEVLYWQDLPCLDNLEILNDNN